MTITIKQAVSNANAHIATMIREARSRSYIAVEGRGDDGQPALPPSEFTPDGARRALALLDRVEPHVAQRKHHIGTLRRDLVEALREDAESTTPHDPLAEWRARKEAITNAATWITSVLETSAPVHAPPAHREKVVRGVATPYMARDSWALSDHADPSVVRAFLGALAEAFPVRGATAQAHLAALMAAGL